MSITKNKISLLDLTKEEIDTLCLGLGMPKFRATQLYQSLYQYKSYAEMNTLPKALISELEKDYIDLPIEIIEAYVGKDNAEKYLYKLSDGSLIEGIFMPHGYGNTLCVSTQVGCRMGCKFCASTLNGLIRNLTPGEILGQVLCVNKRKGGTIKNRAITNVVLMGSGEPLDNFDNVVKFLKLVSSQEGINISLRNISLSTCGIVDKMKELADMDLPVTLTISLHSASDETRSSLMPINRKYNIQQVMEGANYYFKKTGRRIIFEYSLIEGQNCNIKNAKDLAKLVKYTNCHINLINLNYVKEHNLRGTKGATIKDFMEELTVLGVSNTLRRSMGNDIGGACGQLRAKYLEEK